MTRSWNPRSSRKHYERAGSVVLNQVKLGQAPVSLRRIRIVHMGLWVLLVVALVAGGLGLWLTVDSRFYVYDAQIVGARRVSEEEIFEASRLRGLHILWARAETIETRVLEELPSLESADASCHLPSDCTISVVERRPRIMWKENGELWWIDEAGAVFPLDGAQPDGGGDVSGRWTVTGPLPRDEAGNLDNELSVALRELWESGRDLPTSYEFTPGEGLSFVGEHRWRVIVGKGSGMDRRLQAWEQLEAHLESEGLTPAYVDVRFPEAPYYVPAAR
jgi:hypothetical protein